MDLRQLRYFIAVAEEGNYSRAAERLHISQPPLSQQIKSLEGTLRVTLFERGRHGARLTRAGEALLTRARRIVDDCDSVERQVRRVAEGLEGYLRIGIINSVMYGPLPLTLRQFQLRNPGVEWTLHENPTSMRPHAAACARSWSMRSRWWWRWRPTIRWRARRACRCGSCPAMPSCC